MESVLGDRENTQLTEVPHFSRQTWANDVVVEIKLLEIYQSGKGGCERELGVECCKGRGTCQKSLGERRESYPEDIIE